MRLLVGMVLVVGCSDAIDIDKLSIDLRTADCTYLARCGVVESVDDCVTAQLGSHDVTAIDVAAVHAGVARFDGDKARACIDALAARSCDRTDVTARVDPAACREMLTGTRHATEACMQDVECASRRCLVPFSSDACSTGSCSGDAPFAGFGESCATVACDVGLFCNLQGVCAAVGKTGEICGGDDECDYGLACIDGGIVSTCGAPPALGESCVNVCRDIGAVCTGTCVALGFAGALCQRSAQCGLAYRCDVTGHCDAGIGLGDTCAIDERCADPDAFCGPLHTCTNELLPTDEPCHADRECASGICGGVCLDAPCL